MIAESNMCEHKWVGYKNFDEAGDYVSTYCYCAECGKVIEGVE